MSAGYDTKIGVPDQPAPAKGGAGNAPTAFVTVGTGMFVALLAYAVVEFVRPQNVFNINASWFRPALMLSVVLFVYWIRTWGLKAIVGDRILLCICFICAMSVLWVPFATNNTAALRAAIAHATNLTVIVVPLGLFLVSAKRRSQFFNFWMLVQLYLAMFVIVGGRGPGGILQDENDMAFTLCMSLPFSYLLAQQHGISPSRKVALYVLTLVILLAIVLTHSRGGFVGLASVTLYLIYLSRNRIRNFFICLVLGLVALQFTPDSYFERVSTITDMEDTSINERLTAWRIGWAMLVDNPLFGVGPRNYPWNAFTYQRQLPDFERGGRGLGGRAAHSVWFTVFPEYGLVGGGAFVLMLVTMMRRLGRCERLLEPAVKAGDTEAEGDLLLARALKASMIGFLTSGTFISVFYYPQIWYTAGFVIALSRGVLGQYSVLPARSPETGAGARGFAHY